MTTRRSFLKGLFVAPAIVAATNIMPVRAVDMLIKPDGNPFGMKAGPLDLIMAGNGGNCLVMPAGVQIANGTSRVITDLTEINSFASEWHLVEFKGSGERRWMSRWTMETIKFDHSHIKSMTVDTHREIDTTVALMKSEPGSSVIWGLTPDMTKPFSRYK